MRRNREPQVAPVSSDSAFKEMTFGADYSLTSVYRGKYVTVAEEGNAVEEFPMNIEKKWLLLEEGEIRGAGVENGIGFDITGTINREDLTFDARQVFEDGYEIFFWGDISVESIDGFWGYQ